MTKAVVTLERTRIECPAPRRARPGYRWTTGYYVIDPVTGNKQYPPARRADAIQQARGQWPGCRIEYKDES